VGVAVHSWLAAPEHGACTAVSPPCAMSRHSDECLARSMVGRAGIPVVGVGDGDGDGDGDGAGLAVACAAADRASGFGSGDSPCQANTPPTTTATTKKAAEPMISQSCCLGRRRPAACGRAATRPAT
jgi:hypothetical protein